MAGIKGKSGIYKRTDKMRRNMSLAHVGHVSSNKGKRLSPRSEETKRKISKSLPKGKNHHNWKGSEAGYRALHYWVERRLGKPQCCDFCEELGKSCYHWANKSGEYKREVTDWIRLCTKCHKAYDKARRVTL